MAYSRSFHEHVESWASERLSARAEVYAGVVCCLIVLFASSFTSVLSLAEEPLPENQPFCGPEALYIAASLAKYEITIDRIMQETQLGADGCSLEDLRRTAAKLGIRARAIRFDASVLGYAQCSLVVHQTDHFSAVMIPVKGVLVWASPDLAQGPVTDNQISQISHIALAILPKDEERGQASQQTLSSDTSVWITAAMMGIIGGAALRLMRKRVRARSKELSRSGKTLP